MSTFVNIVLANCLSHPSYVKSEDRQKYSKIPTESALTNLKATTSKFKIWLVDANFKYYPQYLKPYIENGYVDIYIGTGVDLLKHDPSLVESSGLVYVDYAPSKAVKAYGSYQLANEIWKAVDDMTKYGKTFIVGARNSTGVDVLELYQRGEARGVSPLPSPFSALADKRNDETVSMININLLLLRTIQTIETIGPETSTVDMSLVFYHLLMWNLDFENLRYQKRAQVCSYLKTTLNKFLFNSKVTRMEELPADLDDVVQGLKTLSEFSDRSLVQKTLIQRPMTLISI